MGLVDKPGGCRDRAVLLVGFGAALRRSELIALDLDDIAITQAGLTLLSEGWPGSDDWRRSRRTIRRAQIDRVEEARGDDRVTRIAG